MLTSLFTRCRSAQKPRVMRTSVSARGRVAHDAPGVWNTGPRTVASGVVESTGGVDMEPPEGYRNRFRDETYDLARCLVKGAGSAGRRHVLGGQTRWRSSKAPR